MSLDVSINLSTSFSPGEEPGPEIEVTLGCYLIQRLAEEIDALWAVIENTFSFSLR